MAADTNDGPTRAAVVTLREIPPEMKDAIVALATTPEQRKFVATNADSFEDALEEPDHAWYRAIFADETPVGFLMLYDDSDKPEYYLWRFMLDARYQRMGFGTRALHLLVAHVRTRPNATCLTLSYELGEGGPADFYHRYGFVDTGELMDGEIVSRLALA